MLRRMINNVTISEIYARRAYSAKLKLRPIFFQKSNIKTLESSKNQRKKPNNHSAAKKSSKLEI